jgi:hypothetical protein
MQYFYCFLKSGVDFTKKEKRNKKGGREGRGGQMINVKKKKEKF